MYIDKIILLFEIPNFLLTIIKQNKRIMATLEELAGQVETLKTQVGELQASVDAEQAAIAALLESNAAVVVELNAQIEALKAELAGAATPEALQVIADGLSEVSASIAVTKSDIEGTV